VRFLFQKKFNFLQKKVIIAQNISNLKIKNLMKKSNLLFILMLLFSISLTSCGVMFGGSKYNAKIVAKNLPNAEIYVNGDKAGNGIVTNSYYRNRPLEVEIRQEGCEDYKKTYHKTFRTGNFILSTISWGIIGIGVDLGTGASYKPDPKGESSITKLSDKDFHFNVQHPKCTKD